MSIYGLFAIYQTRFAHIVLIKRIVKFVAKNLLLTLLFINLTDFFLF